MDTCALHDCTVLSLCELVQKGTNVDKPGFSRLVFIAAHKNLNCTSLMSGLDDDRQRSFIDCVYYI